LMGLPRLSISFPFVTNFSTNPRRTAMKIIAFDLDNEPIQPEMMDMISKHPIIKLVSDNYDLFFHTYCEGCIARGLTHGFLTIDWADVKKLGANARITGSLNICDFVRFEPQRPEDSRFPYKYDFDNNWYVTVIHHDVNFMFEIEFPIYN